MSRGFIVVLALRPSSLMNLLTSSDQQIPQADAGCQLDILEIQVEDSFEVSGQGFRYLQAVSTILENIHANPGLTHDWAPAETK